MIQRKPAWLAGFRYTARYSGSPLKTAGNRPAGVFTGAQLARTLTADRLVGMTSDRDRMILRAIGHRGADLEQLHERVEQFDPVELEWLLERDLIERRTPQALAETTPLDDEPGVVFHLTPTGAGEIDVDPNSLLGY
jgi:hypothetical protein